jgi:hypothetical protein
MGKTDGRNNKLDDDGKGSRVAVDLLCTCFSKELYKPGPVAIISFYSFLAVSFYYVLSGMDAVAGLLLLACMLLLVVFSGLPAQKAMFHPMGDLFSVVFLYTSIFSLFAARLLSSYLLAFTMALFLGVIGLVLSLLSVCVRSQRRSKLLSLKIDEGFFNEMEKSWSEKLKNHPEACEKIASDIRLSKDVLKFFEDGMFSLAVLWSCNTVEKVVDEITDLMVAQDPRSKQQLLNEKGGRLPYPKRLQFFGFPKEESEEIWHELRNKIAHHNYVPNFRETCKAIEFLRSFLSKPSSPDFSLAL